MTDFDEDGTHDTVIEKLDITGDGEYNVFKYGYVNPAGEISYHTIVYEAHPVQTQVDKKSETMSTERFDLEQERLGTAQRTMFVTTITNNIVEQNYYSIQEDVDLDGFMDRETSYEVIYNNIEVITYTKEVTEIEVNLEVDEFDIAEEVVQTETSFLEELRVSSFVSSKMSQTMTFSDIEWDEVVSTRVYEDAFPNELSEFSSVENYLIPAISSSITSQTIDLSAMFELSHSRDDVPVEFDKLTTIENGEIVTENLLAINQSISFPGTYSVNDQGFDSYSVEAIKSEPAEGTYWLNDLKSSSLSNVDQDGYYLYLDTSDDSVYETVIVMDKYDNVVGIGFDYDLDSKFHPGKTLPVEKDIIWSENYGGDSITDDYIHFRETDKEVGVFNEPTFTDVLFDVNRMVFTQNNELMTLAEDMATNQFEEQVNLVEDVFIQTVAGLAGFAGGILASYACMPKLGYMLGYLAVMIPYQIVKILEQENYLAHRTFRLDGAADDKVLGEKFWFDDMYGDIMPITMFGSFGGVYAPVYGQTDKRSYSADVLVREFNFEESKASSLFTSYDYPKLDYWLSTRNVAGYSDFDEPLVIGYLQSTGVVNPFIFGFGIPEYNHAKSSVYYLENQVQEETDDNDDAYLNAIVPTIDYDYANDRFSPRFSFVDSTGGFPAPEFYTEYPVIVSEDSSAVNQYCSIYKLVAIDDPEETTAIEIQLFDAESELEAEIVEIHAYLVWTQTIYSSSASEIAIPITSTESSYVNTMVAGEFEVDLSEGTITISSGQALSAILNSYVAKVDMLDGNFVSVSYSQPKILFQIKVEKYRSISDVRDLTQEQVNKIATAQAIEAAILEYNYQFNLATQTQLGFHEIIYTSIVTAISTALTMAATYGIGSLVSSLTSVSTTTVSKGISRMFTAATGGAISFTAPIVARAVVREIGQELILDPWIESTVSGLVRRIGGNAIWQMVLSSIAESGREALTGPLTNLINPSQSQQSSFASKIESEYFAKGLKPTVQDLLTAFDEHRNKIIAQQEQRKENMRLLGGATRALSFVSLAICFTASQFLGPVGALVYSTLVVYCFSEDISLKSVFHKVFNSVMGSASKVSRSKVGNVIRNTKEFIIENLGIGIWAATFGTITSFLTLSMGPVGFLNGLGLTVASLFGMVKIDTSELRIISKGNEKILIKKIFKIIFPYISPKSLTSRNFYNLVSVERIISTALANIANKDGYKPYSSRGFLTAISKNGLLGPNFLERYEFLYKFSSVFSSKQRKALLKASRAYQKKKKVAREDSIHPLLLQEFHLVKLIREAYYREYKDYLSLRALSAKIDKSSPEFLTYHFCKSKSGNFLPFKIFHIEQWCKKNLPNNFKEIQVEISNWRIDHNDDSVYAVQNNPFRIIAHQLLILHYQETSTLINFPVLDKIIKKEIPHFPANFFGNRVKKSYKSYISDSNMLLLKSFVKNYYDAEKKETQQLINDIDAYIQIDRRYGRSHTLNFMKVKSFQLKQLIDITKGLDPLYCNFFTNEELYEVARSGGVCRQHLDDDPGYEYIIALFNDGDALSYNFKLAPLKFLTSHVDIHSRDGLNDMANDVVKARMKHLLELFQMEYNDRLSIDDYFNIFRDQIRSKKDYIYHYKSEVSIWSEFESGKVREMTDNTIRKLVNRWIDSKKMPEQSWYSRYYDKFYREKYLSFINNLFNYMKERAQGKIKPFYEWFLNTYLRNEGLFLYKSSDPFD